MAPRVVAHPEARPKEVSSLSTDRVHPETLAGDAFPAAAQDQDHPHACTDGYVYMSYTVEEDGEEVERVEALPCRRCASEAGR
jgi:hypothetical protein